MSRAWIAFYMGDYLKKTQRLTTEQHGAYMLLLIECWQEGSIPLDDEGRAAIARLPVARWKKIGPALARFFDENGKNKRATEEIEKAENVSLKRSMAGAKGGHKSGISRAIAKGNTIKREANDEAKTKQMLQQTPKQKSGNSEANNKERIITSENVPREKTNPVRSLATAHPTGALARSPGANRFETLEEVVQRKGWTQPQGNPLDQSDHRNDGIPDFLRRSAAG